MIWWKWCHESRRNYPFINVKATKVQKSCVFVLVTWPWQLPEEWPEACSSLTVVGAGTVLALTQLGIRQSDRWRAGIKSTNLHIVVEYETKVWNGLVDGKNKQYTVQCVFPHSWVWMWSPLCMICCEPGERPHTEVVYKTMVIAAYNGKSLIQCLVAWDHWIATKPTRLITSND